MGVSSLSEANMHPFQSTRASRVVTTLRLGIAAVLAVLLSSRALRRLARRREKSVASSSSNEARAAETASLVTARRSLEENEARLSGILESAMDAIITVDENEKIVLFNAAAEKTFGYPADEAKTLRLQALLPERFRSEHSSYIRRFGEIGATTRRMGGQRVVMGLRRNGEEFPIEASISQITQRGKRYYTVILRDVTERRRSEELRERSERRLRGILDSAMDAIITVDEEERIVIFNKAAEEAFGCPSVEAIGTALSRFIPERYRSAHSAHMQRFGNGMIASRRMSAQRIVTGLRANGEEFPIDASISFINEEGKKYYTVILRDVTERQRAELALVRSKEEIRELAATASSAREQEKSRIARELHDDTAQALTAMKMDLTWLKEHMPAGDDELSGKVDTMRTAMDAAIKSVRRMATDLRPLMLDDLGLVPAVESLVYNFRTRTGIACDLRVEPEDFEVGEPHATAVFRIIQESLTNIGKHAQATRAKVSICAGNTAIEFEIRDDGRGFDPQAPRNPGSLGVMGLKERAYLLDGSIVLDSGPGRGTTVRVTLPMAKSAP